MYAKAGLVWRIGTVINNPEVFRVRKQVLRDGKQRTEWVALRKGVAYLFRYREISLQANARCLDWVGCLDEPARRAWCWSATRRAPRRKRWSTRCCCRPARHRAHSATTRRNPAPPEERTGSRAPRRVRPARACGPRQAVVARKLTQGPVPPPRRRG
jgi:hypothetical protein